jgi:hypothetical protein
MCDIETLDLSLFGAWPKASVHDGSGGSGWSDAECRGEAEAYLLETKSGEPQEALRTLLNEMTLEMRAEFNLFRALRATAEETASANAGEGGDEAAAKLARADIKAAVDAMSLIVRTLEKIDALQRQINRDRELESERHAEAPGYEETKTRLLAIIEQRVGDKVQAVLAERKAGASVNGTGPPNIDLPPCGGDVGPADRAG